MSLCIIASPSPPCPALRPTPCPMMCSGVTLQPGRYLSHDVPGLPACLSVSGAVHPQIFSNACFLACVGGTVEQPQFEIKFTLCFCLSRLPLCPPLQDGADEVDGDLNLVKGRGGALLREKMVAKAADKVGLDKAAN